MDLPAPQTQTIEGCDAIAWTAPHGDRLHRWSTAVLVEGGWILIDPVDVPGLDALLAPQGPVRAVRLLLDRHRRDGAAIAARHGCALLGPDRVPGGRDLPIPAIPGWTEHALWMPERGLLVCADALGTAPYFLARSSDRLGVHPLLRLRPPSRALGGLEPRAVAVGHGAPLTEGAASALREALATARSGLPRAWWRAARSALPGAAA